MEKKKRLFNNTTPILSNWMLTFSDIITLLITFFVLIVSMSSMDEKSLKQSFSYFQDQPSLFQSTSPGGKELLYHKKKYPLSAEDSARVFFLIKRYDLTKQQSLKLLILEKILKDKIIKYKIKNNDIILTISSDYLFKGLSEEFNFNSKILLERLYNAILLNGKNPIFIDVFTEEFPISTTSIDNNLDLSLKRASALAEYFVVKKKIKQRFINFMGWGFEKTKKNVIKITLKDFLNIYNS